VGQTKVKFKHIFSLSWEFWVVGGGWWWWWCTRLRGFLDSKLWLLKTRPAALKFIVRYYEKLLRTWPRHLAVQLHEIMINCSAPSLQTEHEAAPNHLNLQWGIKGLNPYSKLQILKHTIDPKMVIRNSFMRTSYDIIKLKYIATILKKKYKSTREIKSYQKLIYIVKI